jgi:hypothetical protein
VVNPGFSRSENKLKIDPTLLTPNQQPYSEIKYNPSPVVTSVFLLRWVEALSHNHLVSFGYYEVSVKDNYLSIVDMNMVKSRVNLIDDIRITYSDPMVVKLSSSYFEVTLSRGSPFMTIEDVKNKIFDEKMKKFMFEFSTEENNITKLFEIDRNIYNLLIIPDEIDVYNFLEKNKNVIIERSEVSQNGDIHWHTRGSGMLLLFVPAYLPSVAPETGIRFDSARGEFKLLRGSVWKYKPVENKIKQQLPAPSDMDDIRYDVDNGRYVDINHENESDIHIAPLAQKLIEENKLQLAYPLLRHLYGGIIEIDPFFPSWYSVDFYRREVIVIDVGNVDYTETIKSVFSKL